MPQVGVYDVYASIIGKNCVVALHDANFNEKLMSASFARLGDILDPRDGDCLFWSSTESVGALECVCGALECVCGALECVWEEDESGRPMSGGSVRQARHSVALRETCAQPRSRAATPFTSFTSFAPLCSTGISRRTSIS